VSSGNERILVVEDEESLALSLEERLVKAGYRVEVTMDGLDAEQRLRNQVFDLVVMDVNLPGKRGDQVILDLRNSGSTVPFLILSVRSSVDERVHGLECGADDYLPKPFEWIELLARIKAILLRSGHVPKTILHAEDLALDTIQRTVKRGGKHVHLTPREYELLKFFLENKNQVLTRRKIVEEVWGYGFDPGTNVVDVYVSYLRNAIDRDFDKKLIVSVRGEGFMLRDEKTR
jgi:DNA-binding response OmpR family regulator